jgi:hypothetical protein
MATVAVAVEGYIAHEPIKHNGESLMPGDTVPLGVITQKHAQALLELGAIEPAEWIEQQEVKETKKAPPAPTPAPTPAPAPAPAADTVSPAAK